MADVRQAVLRAARIEDHAERAGFRPARGGKWHCGIHADKNPSCSVRSGRIRCWVCSEAWNVIDLEMIATGGSFPSSLRSLAREYGLSIRDHDPSTANRNAKEWCELQEQAFSWRAAFLELADEILAEEKSKLFDATDDPDASLIWSLTAMESKIRSAASIRGLVAIFQAFNKVMPSLAGVLASHGEQVRRARQTALANCIAVMAKADDQC